MSQAQTVETKNTYDLFMGYLDVVNDALEEHSDTPVIGKLSKMLTDMAESRKIGAAIYESDPQSPFDYFTVRIADGKVQLDSRGKNEPDIDWRHQTQPRRLPSALGAAMGKPPIHSLARQSTRQSLEMA